jgi:predicted transcriptional regulator
MFRTSHPDSSAAFRLPAELLAIVDTLCGDLDLTRSQLFRRSVTEYIKTHDHDRQQTIQRQTNEGLHDKKKEENDDIEEV